MTVYGRPGVYATETFQPLQSVSSVPAVSVPALVAVHPRGPLSPQLITSPGQFTKLYGSFSDTAYSGSILPFAVNDFFSNGGTACYVLRIANNDATHSSLALEDQAGTDTGSGGALTLTAASPGIWGQTLSVTVTSTTGTDGNQYFNLQLWQNGSVVESFVYLSMDPSSPRYAVPILSSPKSGSQYVSVTNNITHYTPGSNDLVPVSSPTPLTGGSDGATPANLGTVVPDLLDQIPDQIMAINLPGVSSAATLNALIAWAGQDGDKMIVCDGPAPDPAQVGGSTYAAQATENYLALVQTGSPALTPSQYGCVYGPWRLVSDPASSSAGATRYAPPGPAVLAQWQQNDSLVGPWQTPAGINYRVSALALEASFTPSQLDTLNLANVNVIRQVPGYGICIMGGRTLASSYPDQYLSVQREMMALEFEMENLLQFALFEPNGPELWAQITSVLNNYLNQQFQAGAFAGTTTADSYQVICDGTNNTQSSAQSGLVNIAVNVALLSPAEWIQLDLTQTNALATLATS